MKRLISERITIIASALGILLNLFLIPIQSRIWNGSQDCAISNFLTTFLAKDALLDEPVKSTLNMPQEYFKYGHYFVLVYFSLLIAIWTSSFIRQQWLKNSALLITSIALSANVLIYWASEYLTIYAREIFFIYIEVPAITILLLLFTIIAYKSKEQDHSKWKKYVYLLPVLLSLLWTILFQYIPHAPILALLICILILSLNNQQMPKIDTKLNWYAIIIRIAAIILIVISFGISIGIKYQPTTIIGENQEIKIEAFSKNSGIELYVFNTGFNRMAKALSPTYKKWRPCPIYLIKHPKFGYVLFDSGISEKVALEGQNGLGFPMSFLFESKSKLEMLAFNQIKQLGIKPEDIKYLAISHLHDDHIGTVDAFKNAVLIMNSKANTKEGSLTRFTAASSFKESNSSLGKSYDLFGDKTIQLIEKPGHTDSDLMLLVTLNQGPVLLSGDAVVHDDWLKSNDVERLPTQPAKAAQNRNNIRNLETKMPEFIVFPGHDMPNIPKNRTDIHIINPEFFKTRNLNIK
ncbi:MBL fold metallo-hydrolase [Flavobacterium sp. ov086]|uniref:MBL fold metallo-hydrolase n=1 Tax=Flavobacterium sp. ov086 TaxID=1761785 RepID=UPI000B6C097B|nr:MBL fold metallo-hydrolase [Flavobacterium sp. ov086]SNR38246.1 Glyoxylase, beta-lactamase superfamily II [Flavobacterium sp. ov086]